MQTNYVRYFVDAAKLGSITLTAERNFMSPQGVSRAIASLEGDLGQTLFYRSNNRISLTRAGNEFLAYAEKLLEVEDGAFGHLAKVREKDADASQNVFYAYCTAAAFDTSLFYPLADGVRGLFRKTRFFQKTNDSVVEALLKTAEEGDDAAVSFGLLAIFDLFADENADNLRRLKDAGYEYLPFIQCNDLVLVAEDSPLAQKRLLTRSDILSYPLAVSLGDMGKAVRTLFGEDHIYVQTEDKTFRERLVARGEAVTFVPALSLAYGIGRGIVAVPMADPYLVEYGFVARPEVMASSFIGNIIDKINGSYRSHVGGRGDLQLLASSQERRIGHASIDSQKVESELLKRTVERYGLTRRESEALAFLLEGKGAADMSAKLSMSISTARTHIQNVYKKTGVHEQRELMYLLER